MSDPNAPRFYTPEEANSMLPSLKTRIGELLRCVEAAQRVASEAEGASDSGARDSALQRLDDHHKRVEGALEAITRHGIEVKGLVPALLDFPALRNGQHVYLCWREGEDTVEWWHPMHTGFSGRQKLDPGEAGAWEWVS